MNQLRVETLVTLKRPDGKLMSPGACWKGTMETLPDFIRLAIEKNKPYLKVTEIAEIVDNPVTEVTPLQEVELSNAAPVTAEIEQGKPLETKLSKKKGTKK